MNLINTFEKLINTDIRIIFPSYTYSSRRNEVYDHSNTLPDPQVGAVSRLIFEKAEYLSRTLDPDFSYLILGNQEQKLSTDISEFRRSFGENSHHNQLFQTKSAILLIGPVLETGLTPIMHLESLMGVPWRKEIETQYFCARRKKLIRHNYFARVDDFPAEKLPKRRSLYPLIASLPSTEQDPLNSSNWLLFDWTEFSIEFTRRLRSDVFFQAHEPIKGMS
jgi:aminoglycoside N3'-acetyltransferase